MAKEWDIHFLMHLAQLLLVVVWNLQRTKGFVAIYRQSDRCVKGIQVPPAFFSLSLLLSKCNFFHHSSPDERRMRHKSCLPHC